MRLYFEFDELRADAFEHRQIYGRKNPKQSSAPNRKAPSERNALGEPHLDVGNQTGVQSDSGSEVGSAGNDEQDSGKLDVVARVSLHALREERTYYICKKLIQSVDPHGEHIVKPVDMLKLQSHPGDAGTIMVTIWIRPGLNYLHNVIDYGPAFYKGRNVGGDVEPYYEEPTPLIPIPLQTFMDFAVGATECLEILHHKERIVHGEIRGEAFHLCEDTGKIRLMNFGSGLRTFEHGLTSTGWSALSKENGAKRKLSFMSPEQTGRMPAEPDSRTDIYALGVVFWNMLTQQPPFEGETPMDIIQGVLGRRLPLVSSLRLDVPEVVGRIIQKMTAKIIGERYHSASGLKHDLTEVRNLLGAGDSDALESFQIATKDISSFFILPTAMIGRTQEYEEVVKVIDKVSKKHLAGQKQDVQSISSGSSEGFEIAIAEASSLSEDAVSSAEYDRPSISLGRSNSLSGEVRSSKSGSSLKPSAGGSHSHSNSIEEREPYVRPWEKNSSLSLDTGSFTDSMSHQAGGSRSSDSVGSIHHRNIPKFRRKGRCEVVSISGVSEFPFRIPSFCPYSFGLDNIKWRSKSDVGLKQLAKYTISPQSN
jgi:serine/threonine protein kinase